MSSDLTKHFHDNTYVYTYPFVLISILISRHRFCHPCIDQYLYFLTPKYTELRISSISYIDLDRHDHAVLQSYFIKRPKDITPVYEEGQIPSRTLMSLFIKYPLISYSDLYASALTTPNIMPCRFWTIFIRYTVLFNVTNARRCRCCDKKKQNK